MKVSELAQATGVSVPTIKYYLREKLLMPGTARGATQADYGEEHARRLRLIRSLSDVAGLPIQKIKTILALIEDPGDDLFTTLGRAVTALPPYLDEHRDGGEAASHERSVALSNDDGEASAPAEYPRARAALAAIGQIYDPHFTAVAQLDRALAAVEDAGIPITDDRLRAYAEHVRAIAAFDLERMPRSSSHEAVEYAVLGTALYEPVVVAMRRLAHQDLAARMLDA
jgi:DNA-binding transcriptional MerR regulator